MNTIATPGETGSGKGQAGKTQIGKTRANDVFARMREDIISCDFRPGEKLRFEPLRERYEVSFSTLREALSRLEGVGLVVSQGQRGYVVSPVSIADLEDLTDMRVLIEREALRRSMKYGDDTWEAGLLSSFYRMDRLQDRLETEYYKSEEWTALHGQFHSALVQACRSPTMLEMRATLFERAHRYRRMSSQFRTKWRPKAVEHKAIMDAALDRSESLALDLIDRHIRETTENVIEHAGHLFIAEADD